LALIGASLLLAAPLAQAAQFVYPIRGQDMARQAGDEADCSTLAKQQSGFDPPKTALQDYAPVGTASDTAATGSMTLGSVGANGLQGGPAGALGGGGPGTVGSEVTAMTGSTGPSLGVLDDLTGAPEPATGTLQLGVRRPQLAAGQADYEKDRAACLTARGYSVQ
jgi:hypothetical protein